MGLDQYLNGRKYHLKPYPRDPNIPKEETFELGYWRKHPDLHGFIVQTFAGGEDDCRPIELDRVKLEQIINAVEADALPHTEGFFFGQSYKPGEDGPEVFDEIQRDGTLKKVVYEGGYSKQKAEDLALLRGAIEWLEREEPDVWKHVEYEASW